MVVCVRCSAAIMHWMAAAPAMQACASKRARPLGSTASPRLSGGRAHPSGAVRDCVASGAACAAVIDLFVLSGLLVTLSRRKNIVKPLSCCDPCSVM